MINKKNYSVYLSPQLEENEASIDYFAVKIPLSNFDFGLEKELSRRPITTTLRGEKISYNKTTHVENKKIVRGSITGDFDPFVAWFFIAAGNALPYTTLNSPSSGYIQHYYGENTANSYYPEHYGDLSPKFSAIVQVESQGLFGEVHYIQERYYNLQCNKFTIDVKAKGLAKYNIEFIGAGYEAKLILTNSGNPLAMQESASYLHKPFLWTDVNVSGTDLEAESVLIELNNNLSPVYTLNTSQMPSYFTSKKGKELNVSFSAISESKDDKYNYESRALDYQNINIEFTQSSESGDYNHFQIFSFFKGTELIEYKRELQEGSNIIRSMSKYSLRLAEKLKLKLYEHSDYPHYFKLFILDEGIHGILNKNKLT